MGRDGIGNLFEGEGDDDGNGDENDNDNDHDHCTVFMCNNLKNILCIKSPFCCRLF